MPRAWRRSSRRSRQAGCLHYQDRGQEHDGDQAPPSGHVAEAFQRHPEGDTTNNAAKRDAEMRNARCPAGGVEVRHGDAVVEEAGPSPGSGEGYKCAGHDEGWLVSGKQQQATRAHCH